MYYSYVGTLRSSWTRALVRVDEVDAGAPILTGLRLALIDLLGTVDAVETRDTLAEIKRKCN